MKHHNGCKHKDKISGNCKLKPYGVFTAIFGRKCDYHPLHKFKCYEQEERLEFTPPKGQKPQGATFYNCEFIDCTFTETETKPKTEAETLEEQYEEACGDFITRIRSCFDLYTEEYFILVKMKGIWLPLMEFYTLDKAEHMRIFLLIVERIKNENSI